jgi:hypothetical protein
MGRRIKIAVATVACCVALATGIWLGVIWEASRPEPVEQKTVVVEPISEGEKSGEVYSVEIWDNGEARIMTTVPYVQQVSEHTIVITDRDMSAVIEEIQEAMK